MSPVGAPPDAVGSEWKGVQTIPGTDECNNTLTHGHKNGSHRDWMTALLVMTWTM